MPVVSRGANNPFAADVQRWLNMDLDARGDTTTVRLKVDGEYGGKTAALLGSFQQRHAFSVNGDLVVEPVWEALADVERAILLRKLREHLDANRAHVVSQVMLSTITTAINAVGWREEPPGSNKGPRIDPIVKGWYSPETLAKLGAPPWCALFVSYCFAKSYGTLDRCLLQRRIGSASDFQTLGTRLGRYTPSDKVGSADLLLPAIGLMSREHSGSDTSINPHGAGHVFFILWREGDTVVTVEGNVSQGVNSRRRKLADLGGVFSLEGA